MSFLISILFSLFILVQPDLNKTESWLKVHGDSSMHEWTMELERFDVNSKWDGESLTQISISSEVKALKSGKDNMDENAWDALLYEKFPSLAFISESIEQLAGNKVNATGQLTIGGVSKVAVVEGAINQENSRIVLRGKHSIDMTQHDIDPPTAMFGMMKVDKEVTIDFKLVFTKN